MQKSAWLLAVAALLLAARTMAAPTPAKGPDTVSTIPLAAVTKTLYRQSTVVGKSLYVAQGYVGPGLERWEVESLEVRSDDHANRLLRFSADNGRTWSAPQPLPNTTQFHHGIEVWEGEGPMYYDEVTKVWLGAWLRQIVYQQTYHCFTYWRVSRDGGRSWGAARQFVYEPGEPFDPRNAHAPGYLTHNHTYPGNNFLRLRNGTVVYAVTSVTIPATAPDPDPQQKYGNWWIPTGWRDIGSRCFVGRWNAAQQDYDWQAGNCVWVPMAVSCRGLMEAQLAELHDGRLLVLWRGSNTDQTPGRKWYSTSADGGLTLGPVQELKYADGSRFYSPSSIHATLRHGVTGKLYWIGNICAEPPQGNSPRHPLVIAEVDETIPALKRETVTPIDQRPPGQQDALGFSNFSYFEDRETHAIELYMTSFPELPSDGTAHCYRYVVTLLGQRG